MLWSNLHLDHYILRVVHETQPEVTGVCVL
jgi:hypothetical protein